MGAQISGSKSNQSGKSDTTESQKTVENSTGSGTFSNRATFDPAAQGTIDTLSGAFGNVGQDVGTSSDFLKSMLMPNAGMNPYAQQVVDTQNKVSNQDFQNRLAGVRSGGYGGGIGRDLMDQGMFTSDFTNNQAAWNAKTLLDAFNQDRGMQLNAAGQLSGNDAGRLQGALEYLNTLKGQSGEQAQQASGVTDTTGKSSTTSSGKSSTIGAKVGAGKAG